MPALLIFAGKYLYRWDKNRVSRQKYKFVWKKAVLKNTDKLLAKLPAFICQCKSGFIFPQISQQRQGQRSGRKHAFGYGA